jgi:Zn-dependent M28 family amino/carboxypeptidase
VRRPTAFLVAALLIAGCGDDGSTTRTSGERSFDAERAFADLEAQVAIGPRPSGSRANLETARLIASRLEDAGAERVSIQQPWRNVVGVIPGDEPGAIVLGAHFDTKNDIQGFVGANDGASGVAVVLEIARALSGRVDGPSVYLALFDAEEARGERPFQYVRIARAGGAPGVPPLDRIKSMVLLDMVGDCDLAIPREAGSDAELYESIAAAGDPFGGGTSPVLDDHIPFLNAGIPAVDLIDFEFGPENSWWHTTEDTLDKVCPESLDAVGEAVLRVLPATL